MPKLSRENFALSIILLIAAFFRFYRLDQIPPGFQFDQAFNAFDILRLLQGQFAIFFPANTGREPLYFYLAMPSVAIFGPTAFAIKFTSAIIGLVTVPLIYGFAREFFHSQRIALFSATFAAISLWHIFFSRDGLRVILAVPLTLLAFWYLWRVVRPLPIPPLSQGREWAGFALSGLFTALGLYTYPSARLLPIAILFLILFAALKERDRAKVLFKGLAISFTIAAMVFAPLGAYFFFHPDQFIAHTESISIFSERVNEGDIPGAILKNLIGILGMFFVQGDGGSIHNLPWRPVFDPLVGAFFVVGVIIAGGCLFSSRVERTNEMRAKFLATWLAISLVTSLLSDDAPNFLRTLPAFPAMIILAAWGASSVWDWFQSRLSNRVTHSFFIAIILVSGWLTYRDYFVVFANLPELYYTYDMDKLGVSDWIKRNESSSTIFLAPLWYQQGTISLLTRNVRLKSFESRDTIVLPAATEGKDALYAFPPEQEKKIETLLARLGALGKREDLNTPSGEKLLVVYRIPAANLSNALVNGGAFLQFQKTERAIWGDQIELLGYRIENEGTGGRNIFATVFLRSLRKMVSDFQFSVKVRGDKDRVWGQEDKFAGDNSYPTSLWDPGDVVVERFNPALNPCAPAGDYRVTVEVYNPMTNQVLGLTSRDGNLVTLTSRHADAPQSNRLEDLEPEQLTDAGISSRIPLHGYTLTPREIHPGESFSLSLFWRGQGSGSTLDAAVQMRDASARSFSLAQKSVTLPGQGRGVCTFFDFTAPKELTQGSASILVNNIKITSLQVIR